MNANFLGKFKAGIIKKQKFSQSQSQINTLETEFHKIAYGSTQANNLGHGSAKHKDLENDRGESSSRKDFPSQTKSIWWQWGRALVNFLTGKQTLSIKEKRLQNGERQWHVYDAPSDTHRVFESEHAVRSWLEQRYYR